MPETTTLHRCQVTTQDGGLATVCDQPAHLYEGKKTRKVYKLCATHFGVFSMDVTPVASGEKSAGS